MPVLNNKKTHTYSHFCPYIPIQLNSTNFKIQKKQINDDVKKGVLKVTRAMSMSLKETLR